MFDSLIKITIGNGAKTLFRRHSWIEGRLVKDIAPLILGMVSTRKLNSRTVEAMVIDNKCISEYQLETGGFVPPVVIHLGRLWSTV